MTLRTTDSRRISEKWGRMAEWLAICVLCFSGYRIVARRWKSKAGEIDIIARRGCSLIFCEVKYRGDAHVAGAPSRHQQHRIMRAAEDFARRNHISPNLEWRFDLIQIGSPFHRNGRIYSHIQNAWQADD